MANFPDGSLAVFSNQALAASVQDRTLQRTFRDALFPALQFRMEAMSELWAQNLGGSQVFSRSGLMDPVTAPAAPGQDPLPETTGIEQWEATAMRWNGTVDTYMPTSYISLASQFLRNVHQLGLQAGQSINRIVRDKLFNAYVAGNTVTDTAANQNDTSIHVVNLNGFTRQLQAGKPQPVTSGNQIPISIPAISYTGFVTAFTADFTVPATGSADEIHSGTLTVTPALTAALPARSAILTKRRSQLVYAGGGNSIDDISANDFLSLRDVRTAVAQLRYANVPRHEDSTFHFHIDPFGTNQLFGDNEIQRLNQSIPEGLMYRRLAIGYIHGCAFYDNNELPHATTIIETPGKGFTTGFETVNAAGVNVRRAIVTGGQVIEEKYLDGARLISDAGMIGKVGEFAITNMGVQVMTERVRLILTAPVNRLQDQPRASWDFMGDFPVPSNELAPSSPATFKSAVVVAYTE